MARGHRRIPYRLGPGYRIYLARDGDEVIILLGGGIKKSQQNDVARAKTLWTEYKLRKAAAAKPKDRS